MRLPRDCSGKEIVRALAVYGYAKTRQTGSHIRLTSSIRGEHHLTIPAHDPVKIGTLSGIIGDVAEHFQVPREEVINKLFGGPTRMGTREEAAGYGPGPRKTERRRVRRTVRRKPKKTKHTPKRKRR